MKRLGEVLWKWRMMRELSQRTVAAMLGISASTLSRLERGEFPDAQTLKLVLCWLLEAEDKTPVTSPLGADIEPAPTPIILGK